MKILTNTDKKSPCLNSTNANSNNHVHTQSQWSLFLAIFIRNYIYSGSAHAMGNLLTPL